MCPVEVTTCKAYPAATALWYIVWVCVSSNGHVLYASPPASVSLSPKARQYRKSPEGITHVQEALLSFQYPWHFVV